MKHRSFDSSPRFPLAFPSRRRFLAQLSRFGLLTLIPFSLPIGRRTAHAAPAPQPLATAAGTDPAALVREVLGKLGGMRQFVSAGDRVVVKPNIGWDRTPEEAANTHPEVVAELCRQALDAGAGEVRVFDRTCNDARRTYQRSGINDALASFGSRVRLEHVNDNRFEVTEIPGAEKLTRWPLYRPALEADVLINVPVLKHHGLSEVTIGMKNLMGLMGGNRGRIHQGIDDNLVDLSLAIRPHLTVVDATRILTRNGPQGGGTGPVRIANRMAACTDVVTADAWGAREFGVGPLTIGHIRRAHERGLGIADLDRVTIL